MLDHLRHLCSLVHQTQIERGLAALYLRDDLESVRELEKQFEVVDAAQQCFRHITPILQSKAAPVADAYKKIVSKRPYIMARTFHAGDAMALYTREVIQPCIDLIAEMAILDTANDPAAVNTFINFIQWKERVGQERAYGTQLASKNLLLSGEFSRQLQYMVQEQMSYERMVIELANDNLKARIEQFTRTPAYQQIVAINQAALNGNLVNLVRGMSAQQWFSLFSVKMDMLHEVSLFVLEHLGSVPPSIPETPELFAVGHSLEKYKAKLKTLPIFQNISASLFNDILRQARLVPYDKGAVIFLEGEQATRFYIILDGWVRVFKGNANGEESVLQMMTQGDNLLETIIFSQVPCPVSAQAVSPCVLLSIPAPTIREKVRSDNSFAVNMLSTVTNRSHQLISQFEQLTLKTVEQRVGWFLLKLFLEGKANSLDFTLPYDKSLIASYLGMKKETFSRALQIFKEKGINIDKNTISLPDAFALCSYCDAALSPKCSRHGSPECSNHDCSG